MTNVNDIEDIFYAEDFSLQLWNPLIIFQSFYVVLLLLLLLLLLLFLESPPVELHDTYEDFLELGVG